jgi:hypothetical protein
MTMPAKVTKLGPGTLVLEATPTSQDMSCQLKSAWVKWDKDKEDDTPVLCGEDVPGGVVYSGKLTGSVFLDLSDGGLVEYTWTNKGTQVPFTFVPSTSAGKEITGTVTVDPLNVGGDEVKKNMIVDFEWDCVGEPDLAAVTP